jgi:hypothetical protein
MSIVKLLNEIMSDGSRNFLLLPVGSTPPLYLLFRVFTLWGAYPIAYVPSYSESWIDFRYRGQKFSINNQFGDYWFFVHNSDCDENILLQVANYFQRVLGSRP